MFNVALFVQEEVLAHKLRCVLESMFARVERYEVFSQDSVPWLARTFDLMVVHATGPVMDLANAWVRDKLWAQPAASIALLPETHLAFAPVLLDAGFDRCLPVSLDGASLCAVARALTRRNQGMTASVCHYGALSFNHVTQQAHVLDIAVELTCREAQVLEALLKRVGQIISKARLIQDIAPDNMDLNTTAAEVYIHRLRKKISHDILPLRNIKRCGYFLPRYVHLGEQKSTHAGFVKNSDDSIRSRYELVRHHLAV
jgi:DNA-binding response OmpR family regulator